MARASAPGDLAGAGEIPVRNVYHMLLYAWSYFQPANVVDVDVENSPNLPSLLGNVLAMGVRQLHRRGPERGYVAQTEVLTGLRGRILVTDSVKNGSYVRRKLVCEFDDFELDILPNQIIRSTISSLLSDQTLDRLIKAQLRDCVRMFAPVNEIRLHSQIFRRVQFHRNNQLYGLLIHICEMLFLLRMPQTQPGHITFRSLEHDEALMATIFEEFVRQFYGHKQKAFTVRRQHIRWDATADDAFHLRYLPTMKTDVTLESATRTIVMECKYYRRTLQSFHGSDSVRSAHLYQLHAYLTNMRIHSDPETQMEGILLYPRAAKEVDMSFRIQQIPIRVYTIDLSKPWEEIEVALLSLLSPRPTAAPTLH